MQKLKCPKCHASEMDRISIKLIDVDQCPRCEGVWFDHFAPELSEILKLGHDKLPPQLQKSLYGEPGHLTNSDKEHEYACPRCGAEMHTYWYAGEARKTFEIDGCSAGCGFWLDDGELGKAFSYLASVKPVAQNKGATQGILGKVEVLRGLKPRKA